MLEPVNEYLIKKFIGFRNLPRVPCIVTRNARAASAKNLKQMLRAMAQAEEDRWDNRPKL